MIATATSLVGYSVKLTKPFSKSLKMNSMSEAKR